MERVCLGEETVVPLGSQVLCVLLVLAHPCAFTIHQPTHVRPPEAIQWRVDVMFSLRSTMVVTVGGHPIDWVTLQGKDTTVCEDVLQPLGRLEGQVCKLPVIRQGDAKHACDEVANKEGEERGPCEEKWSHSCTSMHDREEGSVANILALPLTRQVLAGVHHKVPEAAVADAEEALHRLSSRNHILLTLASWHKGRGGLLHCNSAALGAHKHRSASSNASQAAP
mmetsp:Transcript_65661/g.156952  ORF Transcript_65661/g.156952 Transcript_65661/m.156952 type:complete len:224 (+) Transcript_65661:458-1129(+)